MLLVYPGRFDVAVPTGADVRVLSERDVLPARLWPLLDAADGIVIVDAWSFPFEALRGSDWDLPLAVALPHDIEPDTVVTALADDLFANLGPHDRLVTADEGLWRQLRERFSLTDGQRLQAGVDDTVGAAMEALSARNGDRSSLRHDKARHRVVAAAIRAQLAAAIAVQPTARPFAMLDVARGGQSWAALIRPEQAVDYVGVQLTAGDRDEATRQHPGDSFSAWEDPLPLADERFDVAIATHVLASVETERRRSMLRELYRVTRPGGRLVLVEHVVPADSSDAPWLSTRTLIDDVLGATRRRVVTEHVRALRYPRENRYRTLVMTLTSIGVPTSL